MKYIDWVSILIGVLGGVMLSNLIRLNLPGFLLASLSIIISVVILVLFIYKFVVRGHKIKTTVDERVRAITDKSGRNGLVATYLTLWAILLYTEASNIKFMLDEKLLLIVIAVSLFVYLASFIFYYYRRA